MAQTVERIKSPNAFISQIVPLLQYLEQCLEGVLNTERHAESTANLLSFSAGLLNDLNQSVNSRGTIEDLDLAPDSRLAQLQHRFELSHFDLKILILAIATDLDRRYESLYAYLQDHPHLRRPTIDLALNLFCTTAIDKLARRTHFSSTAPLIQHQLIHLIADSDQPTLLQQFLVPDPQVLQFLLGQSGIDPKLSSFCHLDLLQAPHATDLDRLYPAAQAWHTQQPLRLYFEGRDRSGKHQALRALAAEIKAPILTVDLRQIPKDNFSITLGRICREAWFQTALLHFEFIEALQDSLLYELFLQQIATESRVVILSGQLPWVPSTLHPIGITTIAFPMPDFSQRRQHWQAQLRPNILDDAELDGIADRFRLTSDQINHAIAMANSTAQWRGDAHPTKLDLYEAARTQSGHDLQALAGKVDPIYTWDDLVLPEHPLALLKALCNHAKHRHIVYGDWKLKTRSQGLTALFSGLPGTGKTMSAEVIATELQLDLYRIDLSQIVSKYIGETEKNLDRIFTAATHSNAILLFDEADALFGKRSEVQDAHDRYANIEISYLLQKMETYEGIAILTTNSRSSLDTAFIRRLHFIIEFPLPGAIERSCLWQQVFPPTLPRQDFDLDALAQQFELTGASIRSVALAAAFLAAEASGMLTKSHVMEAIRREYQKVGRVIP